MRESSIYALCDPGSGEIRYIGKTVVPLNIRLSQHFSQAMKGERTHLHCWIRSLHQRPVIKRLCRIPYEHDAEMEQLVITECRAKGVRLVNATDGGEGKKGCLHTEEAKAKIRAWGIGRKMPPKSAETLQRMADAQRGKKQTPEHRAKISASLMGNPPTKGNTGMKASEESRARMREAQLIRRGGLLSEDEKRRRKSVYMAEWKAARRLHTLKIVSLN